MATRAVERSPIGIFASCWVPVLLYLAAILIVSAAPGLRPPLGFQYSDKFYHVLEYGGLGLLLARAFQGTYGFRLPLFAPLLAIGVGLATGIGDEVFQSFVPGRESSVFDVLADLLGLIAAQIVFLFAVRE